MLEVIIGKEGTQRFAINGSRVSRQHAKITVRIVDSGFWKTSTPRMAHTSSMRMMS